VCKGRTSLSSFFKKSPQRVLPSLYTPPPPLPRSLPPFLPPSLPSSLPVRFSLSRQQNCAAVAQIGTSHQRGCDHDDDGRAAAVVWEGKKGERGEGREGGRDGWKERGRG